MGDVRAMKYFFVAGEASGDQHAAALAKSLMKQDPEAHFAFVGGDALTEVVGTEPIAHYKDLAYMGFLDVAMHLGTISKIAKQVQGELLEFAPDVVIPVDYPGFNFRYILPFVRKELPSTKLVYYISPKVWAWKKHRIKRMRTDTDKVLCILPFEESFFEKEQLPQATYVGNPTKQAVDNYIEERGFHHPCAERDTINGKPVLAILCGSRTSEIKRNLPVMLKAAEKIEDGVHIIIAGAPGQTEEVYNSVPKAQGLPILFGHTYEILSRSHIAMVTSGTATLEAALLGTPQVVCYYHGGGWLSNFIFKNFFSVPYISLVNLIANYPVVKELFGGKFKASRVAKEAQRLVKNETYRDEMLRGYEEVAKALGEKVAPDAAAKEILNLLEQ